MQIRLITIIIFLLFLCHFSSGQTKFKIEVKGTGTWRDLGEPSPDYLIENKIRIADENEKIGFANNRGEIIIKPQFESATSFHKGKAIIGETCKKVPWNEHAKETDCHHYSIVCMTHGYINEKGIIIKTGRYSFDQIMKEIGWKAPDE